VPEALENRHLVIAHRLIREEQKPNPKRFATHQEQKTAPASRGRNQSRRPAASAQSKTTKQLGKLQKPGINQIQA